MATQPMNGWEVDNAHFSDAIQIVERSDWYWNKPGRSWCLCTREIPCSRCVAYVGLKAVSCCDHQHDPMTNQEVGYTKTICQSHALIAAMVHRDYAWMRAIFAHGNPNVRTEHEFFQTLHGVRFAVAGEIKATHRMDAFGLAAGIKCDPIMCHMLVDHGADIFAPRQFEKIEPTAKMIGSMLSGSSDGAKRRNVVEWLETLRGRAHGRYITHKKTHALDGEYAELVRIGHLHTMIRYMCSMGGFSAHYLKPEHQRPWAFSGILDLYEYQTCIATYVKGYIHAALRLSTDRPRVASDVPALEPGVWIAGKTELRGRNTILDRLNEYEVVYNVRSQREIAHLREVQARRHSFLTIEERISDIILQYEVRIVTDHEVHRQIITAIRHESFQKPRPRERTAVKGHDDFANTSDDVKTKWVPRSAGRVRRPKPIPARTREELEKIESDEIDDINVHESADQEMDWRQKLHSRLLGITNSIAQDDELSVVASHMSMSEAGDMDTKADTATVAVMGSAFGFPFTPHEVVVPRLPATAAAAAAPVPTKLFAAPAAAAKKTTTTKRSAGLGMKIPS